VIGVGFDGMASTPFRNVIIGEIFGSVFNFITFDFHFFLPLGIILPMLDFLWAIHASPFLRDLAMKPDVAVL
jgi:hypothetical protein